MNLEAGKEIGRRYFNEESPLPAVDENVVEIEDCFLCIHRQWLESPERACSSHHVPCVSLSGLRIAGRNTLDIENAGERFRGDFTIAVHQHNERLLLMCFKNNRLDDIVFRNAERLRGECRSTMFLVRVEVGNEGNVLVSKKADGSRYRDVLLTRVRQSRSLSGVPEPDRQRIRGLWHSNVHRSQNLIRGKSPVRECG